MTGPHSDCLTCAYWGRRIDEEKARALAGDESAYLKEQRARAELAEHLSRDTHPAAQSVEVRV